MALPTWMSLTRIGVVSIATDIVPAAVVSIGTSFVLLELPASVKSAFRLSLWIVIAFLTRMVDRIIAGSKKLNMCVKSSNFLGMYSHGLAGALRFELQDGSWTRSQLAHRIQHTEAL